MYLNIKVYDELANGMAKKPRKLEKVQKKTVTDQSIQYQIWQWQS